MKIMFIGLGLIGGSMAMALAGDQLYAVERDPQTRFEALGRGVVSAAWADAAHAPLEAMDLTCLCLHPQASADFIAAYASRLKPGSLLTDVCGVKQPLAQAIAALPSRDFIYLGGHPMAGKERGGFVNASADLFRGCHYILTPDETVPQEAIEQMRALVTRMGCADVVLTTPKAHDERIAYTSQLMHVLALALCDQRLLFDSFGFEGNSFRGATRVAALDPALWGELFVANREMLADQVDELCDRLHEYSALLRSGDQAALLARLTASSNRKKEFEQLRGLAQSQTPLFR